MGPLATSTKRSSSGRTVHTGLGYYFWWGDTVGYKREKDKWVATDGSSTDFSFEEDNTPTCDDEDILRDEGWIGDDGVLVPEHDAAHIHWGGDWRMPTVDELLELIDKCKWTLKEVNGVEGHVVRGRGAYASASIFLPLAGRGDGTSLRRAGLTGTYWSSVPYSDDAWFLRLNSSCPWTRSSSRFRGRSVRPVQGFTK